MRLLTSISAASEAFVEKEGNNIYCRERKKQRLRKLLSKVTGIEAHIGKRNTSMDCRVCDFWGRISTNTRPEQTPQAEPCLCLSSIFGYWRKMSPLSKCCVKKDILACKSSPRSLVRRETPIGDEMGVEGGMG